jgi:hypothetical protein
MQAVLSSCCATPLSEVVSYVKKITDFGSSSMPRETSKRAKSENAFANRAGAKIRHEINEALLPQRSGDQDSAVAAVGVQISRKPRINQYPPVVVRSGCMHEMQNAVAGPERQAHVRRPI